MKKLVIGALILPVALFGAARPAKAGDKAAAVLAGVAVGLGAAFILDALTSPPAVAAPVVYQPAPVIVQAPPPVVVVAPPVVYQAPPVVYQAPTVVYQAPPQVVYRPAPVIVHGPRYVGPPPRPAYFRADHGRGPWKVKHKHHDD